MESLTDNVIKTEELKEVEAFDDDMTKIIKEYEDKYGKVNLNMFCMNKQDTDVWEALPMTDDQKKYVIISILNNQS
jgi:DNA-binding ferritin-like protein (Dps family)